MRQTIAKQVNKVVDDLTDWLYDKDGGNKYRRSLMPANAMMPAHYRGLADTIERD